MYKEIARMAYAKKTWIGRSLLLFRKSRGIGSSICKEAGSELVRCALEKPITFFYFFFFLLQTAPPSLPNTD